MDSSLSAIYTQTHTLKIDKIKHVDYESQNEVSPKLSLDSEYLVSGFISQAYTTQR